MILNEKKRKLILTTAREILIRNGYAKTTLDDIADSLGMKKSSLYYYYTNKEALIDDVIREEENKYYTLVESVLNKDDSAINKITNYEKQKFHYFEHSVKLHQISSNVLFEFKNKIFEHIKNMHYRETDMIKKILDEAVKNNEIKKCDTKKVAELILIISEGLRHREFYFSSFNLHKAINFNKAIEEMIFAIKLIFDGLAIIDNTKVIKKNLRIDK